MQKVADTPYLVAVTAGIQRLERMLLRVWQIVCLAGVATGVIYGLTISRPLGFACAAVSSAFLIWFVLAGHLFDRGAVPRLMPTLNAVAEATVPWVFTVVITLSNGAEYALASWVPPFLFCAVLIAHVARLRPWMPVLLGLTGALFFPTLYWLFVRQRLPDDSLAFLINQPTTQVVRSLTLLAAGLIASLLVLGLQSAILGAEGAARESDLAGKYRVLSEVAAGATGVVYQAVYCPEGGVELPVAVRRFHSQVTHHEQMVEAFRDAARTAMLLTHPNIVQVRDFLRAAGAHFLVMEWVDGVTLDVLSRNARASGRGIAPEVVAEIGMEMCAGLEHAHAGALGPDGEPVAALHRDLCPEHVFLSRSGEVKLGGFAVARALRDFNRTSEGHADYMPPERAAGVVDERGDLFSVGVMLWELLLGRRRQSGEEPQVSRERPDLAAWDSVFTAVLADDPRERVGTASELWSLLAKTSTALPADTRRALGALVRAVGEDVAAGGAGAVS
jgi:hypothetical protein